jgi:hypothetical protein
LSKGQLETLALGWLMFAERRGINVLYSCPTARSVHSVQNIVHMLLNDVYDRVKRKLTFSACWAPKFILYQLLHMTIQRTTITKLGTTPPPYLMPSGPINLTIQPTQLRTIDLLGLKSGKRPRAVLMASSVLLGLVELWRERENI